MVPAVEKIFALFSRWSHRAVRHRWEMARLPVGEKLRIVEEMIEATRVIAATHPPKPANPVRVSRH